MESSIERAYDQRDCRQRLTEAHIVSQNAAKRFLLGLMSLVGCDSVTVTVEMLAGEVQPSHRPPEFYM